MKRKRPLRNNQYVLDQELLEQYGLGSWLKKNAGVIGAGVGALGFLGGPVLGGITMGLGSQIGGGISQQDAQAEQAQQIAQQNKLTNAQNQFNQQMQQNPQGVYAPTYARGGMLRYGGQTHQGPNGGIPVDAQGNPAVQSGSKPVALTEDKEVAWNSPNQGTYIFSEQLGFAKPAEKIMNKYRKRLGKDFDKEDKISLDSMNKELENLKNQQEQVRQLQGVDNQDMEQEGMEEYGKGGKIHIKPENRGKFNALKKRTGKTTEELTHSKNPLTRKRAIFAQNAKKWKHEDGGYLGDENLELDVNSMITPDYPDTRDYYVNTKGTNSTATKTVGTKTTPMMRLGGGLPKYNGSETPTMKLPIVLLDADDNESGYFDVNYQRPTNKQLRQNWRKNKFIDTDGNFQSESDLYQGNPWIHLAGAGVSMLGNAILQGRDKRPSSIALSRYTPQSVDYSESRRQTREMSELDKANLLRSMRGMGAGYMANATNAITGADRAKYNALAQSMENEGNVNVQMQNEAAARNAQIANQERLLNAQQDDAYNARQRQYLQNYGQSAVGALGAIAQERAYYDALNMSPYYDLVKDPKGGLFRRPKLRAKTNSPITKTTP